MDEQVITLGGGCFWCLEAVFERVQGVTAVQSGYANGHVADPSYEQVCGGDTGCVEVVRVSFDAARIGLPELLEIFFAIHDPTTPNRQGNDVGTQYRSGIYTHDETQLAVARQAIAAAQADHTAPIVTELLPLADYTPAEAYHQHYFERNPGQGYCAFVVAPKVDKFNRAFPARVQK